MLSNLQTDRPLSATSGHWQEHLLQTERSGVRISPGAPNKEGPIGGSFFALFLTATPCHALFEQRQFDCSRQAY